jgi:thymidylate synthase (FAD)
MAFLREPIVRLIAVTHFQKPDDLQEFQIWQTDTDNEPQQLIEAAGRTCYTEDTEVLTDEGWKPFSALRGDELIATLNPQTFTIEYHRPVAKIAYPYKGRIYRVETESLDIAVTPDHYLFHAISTKKKPHFRLMRAVDTYGKYVRYLAWGLWVAPRQTEFILPEVSIPQTVNNQFTTGGREGRPVRWHYRPALTLPMDRWLEFLGYWLTDGTCYYDGQGHHKVVITQHEKRMAKVIDCVKALGFRFSLTRDPRKLAILHLVICDVRLRNYLSQFGHSPERFIPRELMFLPSDQLSILVEALLYGDGTSDGRIFGTASRRLADDFQELLLKTGRVGRISKSHDGTYHIYVRQQYLEYTINPRKGHDGWEDYEGMVYCVTVPPNHIIYVRRNGKPVWCGNCYESWHNPSGRTNEQYIANLLSQGHLSVIEHSVASFYIRGISRAASHEIVRHRHFSYSQRSTRYVDESDCNFIVPDCIADDPEAMRIFAEAVTKAQEAYRQLYELLREKFADVEDRTLRRKLARQAARMVLPNATETALVMTGNFRAWRHFIRMRASEHADVEIRKVAVKVLKELQKVAPAVFGDFQIRQLPDGTEAAEPGYLWE